MGRFRRALVTGGAGFIGSALVRALVEAGCVVRVIDALTYAGSAQNLAEVGGLDFIRGDVCDSDALEQAVEGVDAVFHLAAESHVDRSIAGAEAFVRSNVLGTHRVLEACRRAGCRLLVVSTDEVYGAQLLMERAHEGSPFRPSSPYAATKASADLLAQAAHKTHAQDVVVVRPTNCYGPRQLPEKLIPRAIALALAGRPVPIFGDGQQTREWMHVGDAVAGMLLAAERGAPGEAYNLSPERAVTNLEVVRSALAFVAPGARLEHVPDRPGHDRRYAVSAARARNSLGWAPKVDLSRGLGEVVSWYVLHRDWVEARIGSAA